MKAFIQCLVINNDKSADKTTILREEINFVAGQ